MKSFIETLNTTLDTVIREREKIENQFEEEYKEKIEDAINRISEEYKELEKAISEMVWISDKNSKCGITINNRLYVENTYFKGTVNNDKKYFSILEIDSDIYALNKEAVGLFDGTKQVKPLNKVLEIYLKNEENLKKLLLEKYKNGYESSMNYNISIIKNIKEYVENIEKKLED